MKMSLYVVAVAEEDDNDSWNAPDHLRVGITRIEVENWIVDKAF